MQDILSEKVYVPPEVDVLQVQVELGFYGTYRPSGGGGSTIVDDPLYDGGSTTADMPFEPF